MSEETPPSYNTSVFNQANFNEFTSLDTEYLNANYVKYPVTQTGLITIANLATTNDSTINGLTVGKGTNSRTSNTAFGVSALLNAALASTANTSIGYFSLAANTSGASNTVVGSLALQSNTSGSFNTAVGAGAGFIGTANTTGSNNTYVGYQAQANGAAYTNSTALGSGATITASYQVVLGTTAETVRYNKVSPLYTSLPTFASTDIGYTTSFALATLAPGTGIRSTANTSIALPIGVYMCHIYYQINITFPGTTRNIIEFNITSGATLTTRAIMGLVYAPAIQEYNYYSIPAILTVSANPCSVYSELTANGGNCSINSASLAVVRIA